MNAWSAIDRGTTSPTAARPRPRVRQLHLLAMAAAVPSAFAIVAIAAAGAPTSARLATATPGAAPADAAAVLASIPAPAQDQAPPPPDTIRITGTVGRDLTSSLQAAGVPERQGREYLAALATAIPLAGGLSIADRFDLVVLKEDGRLGQLVYAGLDRVGRGDLELMKWTDGKRVRWIDAEGIDPSAQGMELPVAGRVSSGFGERFHPILGRMRMHKGVDLAAAFGTPIVAATDGTVAAAGWSGGYGRRVAVVHAGGIETLYGHMSRIAASPGEHVRRGQVIGYVGSSGLSSGPHLHYEVHKGGKLVNPLSVKLAQSPLTGEELHAFRSRLRGLLVGGRNS